MDVDSRLEAKNKISADWVSPSPLPSSEPLNAREVERGVAGEVGSKEALQF